MRGIALSRAENEWIVSMVMLSMINRSAVRNKEDDEIQFVGDDDEKEDTK